MFLQIFFLHHNRSVLLLDLHVPSTFPVADVPVDLHILHWLMPEDFCPDPFGQSEHIDGPHHGGLHRFDGIVLIMYRRSRTGKVVYFIHFNEERHGNIMADQFEVRIVHQVNNILFLTCKIIIQANNFIPFFQQSFAKM